MQLFIVTVKLRSGTVWERIMILTQPVQNYIINSMYGYKNIHRWSFYSNLGYKRRLDYILCEWFVKRFSVNCRVYRSVSGDFESDHRIVVMTCDFPSKKSRKEIFKKKKQSNRCNIKALKYDPVVVELYSKTLDSELEDTTECGNVDTLK